MAKNHMGLIIWDTKHPNHPGSFAGAQEDLHLRDWVLSHSSGVQPGDVCGRRPSAVIWLQSMNKLCAVSYLLEQKMQVSRQLQIRMNLSRKTQKFLTLPQPFPSFSQVFVHQFLQHSSCRTDDPTEADFFFVPIYASCVMSKKNKYAPESWPQWFLQGWLVWRTNCWVWGKSNCFVEEPVWLYHVHLSSHGLFSLDTYN